MARFRDRQSYPGARADAFRLAEAGVIPRIAKRLFSADVMGLMLLVLALQTLTYGISASLRGTDTTYLFPICLAAALIGLGLGKSKLNGIQASAGMAAAGIIGVWILGARLAQPLLDLVMSVISVIQQIVPAIREKTLIDTSAIVEAWDVVVQASSALTARWQAWMIGLDKNVAVNDALVRNTLWTLLMWLISVWIGWFASRRNASAALLPSIALLAAVTSYSERKTETLWLMVSILLLLMGVWNYRKHTQQWEMQKVDYSDSILYDSGVAVFFLTIVIGVFAFITPSVSWREMRDYVRERNRSAQSEAADMLGIQEQRAPSQNSFFQNPTLPRQHLLSGGSARSEKIVMTIRTGELPPRAEASLGMSIPRYYWRSVTYDVYVGAGWATSSAPPQTYGANTPLIPGLLNGYKLIHLDVQMRRPEGKLFWSGILFSADIPFTANWRLRPQSSLFADQSALLQADVFAVRTNAASYKAESYIPVVTIPELRAAPTDYPDEIRGRYLALPGSVPERVHQLAQDIVAGRTNPYDKAKAIETYLRTYPYDLEVSAPPPDRDVADYFLFDLQRGYCDYYATAMVVLARSSGIPARFVSGYAPGSYDAPNAQYIIRELNAHSWAEIYFPGIGWVEFEPTASQPEIERPPEDIAVPITPNEESSASALLNRFRIKTVLIWILPIATILFLSILYFSVIERWRYLRLSPAMAIERIYQSLYRLGRPLAGERAGAETAYEFTNRLIHRMGKIRKRSRFSNTLLEAQKEIELLTGIYYRSLFSNQPIQRNDAITALKAWKHLRLQLLLARLMRDKPKHEGH